MTHKGKIFGVGLSKTGTTSLASALNVLGYKTKDFPSLNYFPHTLINIKANELYPYDALTDISVIPFYKRLDRKFPGSKFILTIRDKESWLQSCKNYPRFHLPFYRLPLKIIKLRQVIYGTINFDEQKFSEAYDHHYNEIINYFKDRPDDLLILNIGEGNEWEKLCKFLSLAIPEAPFPFKNAKANNYDNQQTKYQTYLSEKQLQKK